MNLPEGQNPVARAAALRAEGRLLEATQAYVEALRADPTNAQTYLDLGTVLFDRQSFADAYQVLGQAMVLDPRLTEARFWAAGTQFMLRRFDEALSLYDQVLARSAEHEVAHYNRGKTLYELGRHEAAVAAYDRALALNPAYMEALANKGAALQALRRHQEALDCHDAAERLSPGLAENANNRGTALLELARFDEAQAAFNETETRAPGHPSSAFNLARLHLLRGDMQAGWPLMEARKRLEKRYGFRAYPRPEWLGGPDIADRTLFVHAEQGLGDTLQFCRYLPLLRARGARVVFACQSSLRPLLGTLDDGIQLIGLDEAPPPFDYHAALMSLPLAFGTRPETIPASIPYLFPEVERVEVWRRRLGEHGIRIGVAWKGSPLGSEIGKAFPLAGLQSIAAQPGVRLISLQKGAGIEELDCLPPGMEVECLGEDFDIGDGAFLDTAAVMQSLDLIITTDTSIAHLAGALGRPAWVALKHVPDWRWLLGRDDSPWYPSLRLFRQGRPDDWADVFLTMADQLAALRTRA